MKIIETDNHDSDYPNEQFVNIPSMSEEDARKIAAAINEVHGGDRAPRYWMVVPDDYKLQPGFEP
jgi:hypothetical protein